MSTENFRNLFCGFCLQKAVAHNLEIILNKVSLLVNKYGIRSITMDEMASSLGISKKTLYQHFRDKKDLIANVLNHTLKSKKEEIKRLLDEPADAISQLIQIHNLVIAFIKDFSIIIEYDLKKYYPGIYEQTHHDYIKLLEELYMAHIRKGKEEGTYRPNLDEKIIAKVHIARVVDLPQNCSISVDEYISDEFSQQLVEYHLRGLIDESKVGLLNEYLNEWKHINH